jgi:hypothetical protein
MHLKVMKGLTNDLNVTHQSCIFHAMKNMRTDVTNYLKKI